MTVIEHDEKAARAAWSRHYGIDVGKRYPCPTRWLTRRQCQGEGCCWYSGDSHPAALDHVYGITRVLDGGRGLLAMPYGLTDDAAADLTKWCVRRGLAWKVLGDGWHYRGTVAIVMFPPDEGGAP